MSSENMKDSSVQDSNVQDTSAQDANVKSANVKSSSENLLEVRDLSIEYRIGADKLRAVDGVSFDLAPGEAMGLVGESGCGKTTAAKGLIRLLPDNGAVSGGSVNFDGRDLTKISDEELRRLRWDEIAWISQAAMNALDPMYRVGDQIVEVMQAHRDISRKDALAHASHLFREVGIDPSRTEAYPHEMSGGMKQRSIIAMSLALDPRLIIADEPTTALDVVTQAQILARMARLRRDHGMALLLITHDISVVVQTCESVVVMYAGQVMERGAVREVFGAPLHPYTMGLRNAFPTLEGAQRELISIPGSPPDLLTPPVGCRFAARCPFATERCLEETPLLREVTPGRWAACHYAERAEEFRELASLDDSWHAVSRRLGTPSETRMSAEHTSAETRSATAASRATPGSKPAGNGEALVHAEDLVRQFHVKRAGAGPFAKRSVVHAVDGIDLELYEGEILGLAGESGSGKTTTGETLVRLQDPTSGHIRFGGGDVAKLRGRGLKHFRRDAQMVFQDPFESLNPRFSIRDIISEPLRIHALASGDELERRTALALERAGLAPAETYLDRFPHELSGGQRQRVAIARAIVLEPRFLVADEPVSMLDVSIRAGVLNLMRRFRDELGLSIVYVSHDLPTIRYVSDRVAIMYLGQVVELGPTEPVIQQRLHPYTQLLLDASPEPDPSVHKPPLEARGEIPSAVEPPNGCRFHTRCPVALSRCGWEARDVVAVVKEARLAMAEDGSDVLPEIGHLKRSGLDLEVGAPLGEDAAIAALEELLESRSGLREAATLKKGAGVVRVEFSAEPSPPRFVVTEGGPDERHEVACWLHEPPGVA